MLILLPTILPILSFPLTKNNSSMFITLISLIFRTNLFLSDFFKNYESSQFTKQVLRIIVHSIPIILSYISFYTFRKNVFWISQIQSMASGSLLFFIFVDVFTHDHTFRFFKCSEKAFHILFYLLGILIVIFCHLI